MFKTLEFNFIMSHVYNVLWPLKSFETIICLLMSVVIKYYEAVIIYSKCPM